MPRPAAKGRKEYVSPMKLFDSHCHVDDVRSYGDDLPAVLQRAQDAEVRKAMVVGVTLASSQRAVALAESHDMLYASVGIHPHDAKECTGKVLSRLAELADSPKVKAWGEVGLDFNRMFSPQEVQEAWFVRQLELADSLGLPLIFHERDSGGRFAELLAAHPGSGRQGVVHCFSGDLSEMTRYLEMGYHIGVTGILTIKQRGADLRKLVPLIPRDRLLIETDAPYLTPAPEKNRVRRNEPAFVRSTLMKLAEVREEDPEELAAAIWENTCRLYNIR